MLGIHRTRNRSKRGTGKGSGAGKGPGPRNLPHTNGGRAGDNGRAARRERGALGRGLMAEHRNPVPTVDIIIELPDGIVLIQRKNPPEGWALPGGFVDYGESLEQAAVREAKEETSLDVELVRQLHTYSDPSRDTRFHTITTVFIATATGHPKGRRRCSGCRRLYP